MPKIISFNNTIIWNIEICDSINQCSFSSANFTLQVNQTFFVAPPPAPPVPPAITDNTFSLITCPLGNLQSTFLFMFFILLAFIIMVIGFYFKIGLVGALGALLLLILSTFTYACIIAVGIVLSGLSLVLLVFFVFNGVRNFT